MNCRSVPLANAAFAAHSSPLGLEYFDSSQNDSLGGHFLVALHGSTKRSLKRGYRVVRIPRNAKSAAGEDFMMGFLDGGKVHGRPVDILRIAPDTFLLTDDRAGVIYSVYPK